LLHLFLSQLLPVLQDDVFVRARMFGHWRRALLYFGVYEWRSIPVGVTKSSTLTD
jgi:hypothetical protein